MNVLFISILDEDYILEPRQVRAGQSGYLWRTRKSDESSGEAEDEEIVPEKRSGGSYLFRSRREPSGPQVRNRKGGYLFR